MSRRFPHPLVLLTACVLLAAALSYLLPAGRYERRDDPVTGRSVVVAGTYERVEARPVDPAAALVAIPRGLADAADVIFLVFLVGGAFTVVEATGAFTTGIRGLLALLGGRDLLVIPLLSIFFAVGGALENFQEEIIPLMPILLVLTRRLGFTPMTALAMSLGPAGIGSAMSPINPFQAGIAQKLTELPLLSGGAFRMVFLVLALGFWISVTMRHAAKTRTAPEEVEADDASSDPRHLLILGLVVAAFSVLIWGLLARGWDFNHMSALFFAMGIVAGLAGRLGFAGTADAYVRGFRDMAYAAILIGFARTIYVVLEEGRIVDTIVHGLFTPLADLPVALSALGMLVAHTFVHVPVPSVSGQAVLTLPVLTPLSDLLGLSRQVTVLAYQYGAGLCDFITPTNGSMMAVLAAAGVRYEEWLRFAWRWYLVLVGLGATAILIAIMIGIE